MADPIDIRRGMDTSAAGEPARFSDLDTQTQDGSFRALAAAAGLYACCYLVAYVAYWLTTSASAGGNEQEQARP